MFRPVVAALAVLVLTPFGSGQAVAAFFTVAGGPGDHPLALGPYTLTAFTDNPPIGTIRTSVASPLGGTLDFGQTLGSNTPASIGQWSGTPANSYAGDVWLPSGVWTGSLTLTLPANTVAFSLYLEPLSFAAARSYTVTLQDGTSLTQTTQSNTTGAAQYGFYATGSDRITSLKIAEPGGNEVIIGEFAIASAPADVSATPEPSSAALLGSGLALVSVGTLVRRKKLRPA